MVFAFLFLRRLFLPAALASLLAVSVANLTTVLEDSFPLVRSGVSALCFPLAFADFCGVAFLAAGFSADSVAASGASSADSVATSAPAIASSVSSVSWIKAIRLLRRGAASGSGSDSGSLFLPIYTSIVSTWFSCASFWVANYRTRISLSCRAYNWFLHGPLRVEPL